MGHFDELSHRNDAIEPYILIHVFLLQLRKDNLIRWLNHGLILKINISCQIL